MGQSNNIPDVLCAAIEDLMIRRDLDQVTDREEALLTAHLKSCERCRAYRHTLMEISEAMAISDEADAIPDPEIPQRVKRRMRATRSARPGALRIFWRPVLGVFRFRIPVYQAAAGVAIVFAAFFALEGFDISDHRVDFKLDRASQTEEPIIVPNNILDHLGIIDEQKIGQTVGEDSLLAKHISEMRDMGFVEGSLGSL